MSERFHDIAVTVNGEEVRERVDARKTLVDFLREDVALTGSHVGCEHGVCGACTVLVDGRSARSCLMLAVQAHETTITTVEGLGDGVLLTPLQEAFREKHALQCGFCTPGLLITLTEFLSENPQPSAVDVREAITGHLCRCTGYQGIVEAALLAAERGGKS